MFRRSKSSGASEVAAQPIRFPGTGSVLALLGLAVLVQYLGQRQTDRGRSGRGQELGQGYGQGSGQESNQELGHGRLANSPSEIPPRGWKDVLVRLYEDVSEHRVLAFAAGMTFYSLLAIFPGLAALVAIYGLFADPASIAAHLGQMNGILPGGAIEIARDQLTRVASKGSQALSITFVVSLAISLWSANAAMKSLFDALNVVYGERERRGFIKLNAISLLFTAGAILFAIIALGAIVVVPIVLNYVGQSSAADSLLRIGRWPAIFVCVALALALIYRYGPDRERPKWRWISWGSSLAGALWLVASVLFSWYTASFGSYNATYGSLGAVVGFMTWLWISATVILVGAELDAELERQTPPPVRPSRSARAAPWPIRSELRADPAELVFALKSSDQKTQEPGVRWSDRASAESRAAAPAVGRRRVGHRSLPWRAAPARSRRYPGCASLVAEGA